MMDNKQVKIFIIAFILVAIILYAITPIIRNYDYSTLPLSPLEPTKTAKIVVVEGNIKNVMYGDALYYSKINNYSLLLDKNINCIPSGNKKLAGYWTPRHIPYQLGLDNTFNAVWVIDGC